MLFIAVAISGLACSQKHFLRGFKLSLFQLPEKLDQIGAKKTAEALLQLRGVDVTVDGYQIQRIGAQAVEVLIAAQKQWDEDGFNINIVKLSSPAIELIERLGLSGHFSLDD